MNELPQIGFNRKAIAVRLLYTILYLVIFEVLKVLIQMTVVFQYVYLFITKKYSERLRVFTNKVASYAYRVMRYITLNENRQPFPFNDFPNELEPPETSADI
jgi:hypothetical protein